MSAIAFPPPAAGPPDLLVVAGEHSGDEHAARLVREALARRPGLKICAVGGPRLAAAGAQLLYDPTGASVIGYLEVFKKYASFFKPLFAETLRWIGAHRPRAVCFVDYGGFNIRLAAALRERGLSAKGGGPIRTLYYISPQVWASRAGRRFKIADGVDALAVIFPFEPEAYADTGLPVEFVGHPFTAADYRPPVRFDPEGPVLLLPGSRPKPVARIFPALLGAHRLVPGRPAVALYPSERIAEVLRGCLSEEDRGRVELRPLASAEAEPASASAVLMSSGTMSVHCALAGIPGAIAYRADPLTYALGRWLVRVRWLGLANLLLGEPMYPEYIQGKARPDALAAELRSCRDDPGRAERAADQAARLRGLLGQASGGTAADWLLRHLDR